MVPGSSDLVVIDHEVTIRNTSAIARAIEIRPGGKLIFNYSDNTKLQVGTLTILPAGLLQIGTSDHPIDANRKAELVFSNYTWDQWELANDPKQFGHGLLAFGNVTIYGADRGDTWKGLTTADPTTGTTSLTLVDDDNVNWQSGANPDTVVIPDTTQWRPDQGATADPDPTLRVEERIVSTISGATLTLTQALSYNNHYGVTYSQDTLRAHVANITRNVIVSSASASGVRGHTLFGGTGTVDIHDALFADLGRTDAILRVFTENPSTHVYDVPNPNNQIGRYAVHFHHFVGPASATDQFVFEGNAVVRSKRWGVAIHDTSYGLVTNNVIYDAQGAGIVTEGGSEIGNEITNNITIKMWGTGLDGVNGPDPGKNQSINDMARGGVGFWFRRTGNTITGNVAADSRFAGYVFDSYYLDGDVHVPHEPGVDHTIGTEGTNYELSRNNPAGTIDGNTAYGMSHHGFWAAYMTGDNRDDAGGFEGFGPEATVLVDDLTLWNTSSTGGAANVYHTTRTRFQNLTIAITPSTTTWNRPEVGPVGVMLVQEYENNFLEIDDGHIEGQVWGIAAPRGDASNPDDGDIADGGLDDDTFDDHPTVIKNIYLKNYFNILVQPVLDHLTSHGSALEVNNVDFDSYALPAVRNMNFPGTTEDRGQFDIAMSFTPSESSLVRRSSVNVIDYDGTMADFRVYYKEQKDDGAYKLPQTAVANLLVANPNPPLIGSPAANRSHAQNLEDYDIAPAGAIAPTDATDTTYTHIWGRTSTTAPTPPTPLITLVSPWEDSVLPGGLQPRTRYNYNHALPTDAAYLWFELDGDGVKHWVDEYKDPSPPSGSSKLNVTTLAGGEHTLKAFFTDESGTIDTSTYSNTVTFYVLPYVTNANDTGSGSLRQAVTDANGVAYPSGTDRIITFNIPGTSTISPGSVLPNFTNAPKFKLFQGTNVTLNAFGTARSLGTFPTVTSPNPHLTILGTGDGSGKLTLATPLTLSAATRITVSSGKLVFGQDSGTATTQYLSLTVSGTGESTFNTTHHLANLDVVDDAKALVLETLSAATYSQDDGSNTTPAQNAAAAIAARTEKVLMMRNLWIDGNGKLDLADNSLVYRPYSYPAEWHSMLLGWLATGANGLAWNGAGLCSSIAANDSRNITALGAMLNDDGLNGSYYNSFSGESVNHNDTLIGFTYYGDADLSGSVDGTVYALIDTGFNGSLAGWFYGDFDYSGEIDGTDYVLIDNGFNNQRTSL